MDIDEGIYIFLWNYVEIHLINHYSSTSLVEIKIIEVPLKSIFNSAANFLLYNISKKYMPLDNFYNECI